MFAWRRIFYPSLALVLGVALGLMAYLRAQLPPIFSLADYRPLQASQVYSDDGALVGTFAHERRTVVPFERIPTHVVQAFLAAEDAGFYQHEGIDWPGVVRALLKNLRPGAHVQGASTITQQTVKALVLGPERSLWRKLREAVLARRLEQLLSKDAILAIYLNQIYFGSGAWGIEQAAQTYFAKHVEELDLAEGALLAAAPKNPRRYTLHGDAKAVKSRQRYVLRQMLAHGWADAGSVRAAMAAALPRPPPPSPLAAAAASYLEHARRLLVAELGDALVHGGGLKIYLGLDAKQQQAALLSLRQTVEDVARSHGYLGGGRRLEVDVFAKALAEAHAHFTPPVAEPCLGCSVAQTMWDFSAVELAPSGPRQLGQSLRSVPLLPFERAEVPVVAVHTTPNEAIVDLGSQLARLPLRRMAWARRYDPVMATPRPSWVGQVVRPGDLITVDVHHLAAQPATVHARGHGKHHRHAGLTEVALVPPTRLEGAVVAIDPHTRLVRALVGGTRSESNAGFNRATQARRQPGSAFKPIVYAAGLLTQTITPATLCNDAPVSIIDPWTGASWRPENYEDGRYDGPITYRRALALSKNTCSVRLLQRMGPQQAIAVARAMGAVEPNGQLPDSLTLALGTGEVTPLALTNAMATLAAGGAFAPPRFVRRIVDAEGRDLSAGIEAEPQQVLPAEVAYVLTSMLEGVVQQGTARRARMLERPLAGKTGTSQASRDVWFTGYAPSLAATTWLGFDNNGSLGRHTGASAALPAWLRFMGVALAHLPPEPFARPPGVVTVRIDAATGTPLVADPSAPNALDEVFVAGTQPTAASPHLPSIFLEDGHMPPALPNSPEPAMAPPPSTGAPAHGADAALLPGDGDAGRGGALPGSHGSAHAEDGNDDESYDAGVDRADDIGDEADGGDDGLGAR